MLQKLHLKLTFLCAGITIFIITLMSCIYLSIAEKNLRENSFLSFQSDMETLMSHLENQSVISYEYLSKLESGGKYTIHLWDNGTPLQFNQRNGSAVGSVDTDLFEDALSYYDSHFTGQSDLMPYASLHKEFTLSPSGRKQEKYYACVGSIYRGSSNSYYDSTPGNILEVCVLKSLAPLQDQILRQRLAFFGLILLSAAVLFLFSYFFTQKLLRPVADKQKQQMQFVSAASHELRTPLAVMLSAASACKMASYEEQASFFKIIEEEGEGMSRLISDLLTLAEADEHRFSMHPVLCEPDTLLLNIYEAYETRASRLGFSLKIQLPDASIPTVYWDLERIRQVLAIFIENAFAYTPQGSEITLSVQAKEKYVQLSVMDNGPGIPQEQKGMLFDRFYRADFSRPKNGHFGLGLSIAKELVTAHKGTIQVTDTPGGGATFTILLPATPFPLRKDDVGL